MKELFKKVFNKETILYVVFGVLTTVVNLAAFKLFNVVFGEKLYLFSNFLAWIVAVAFAYITNKLFVFESKSFAGKIIIKEIISFTGARVLSFVIEEAGLWLLVDICKMGNITWEILPRFISENILPSFSIGGKMIAKILVSIIVVILNYFFSKFFIFKKGENDAK